MQVTKLPFTVCEITHCSDRASHAVHDSRFMAANSVIATCDYHIAATIDKAQRDYEISLDPSASESV